MTSRSRRNFVQRHWIVSFVSIVPLTVLFFAVLHFLIAFGDWLVAATIPLEHTNSSPTLDLWVEGIGGVVFAAGYITMILTYLIEKRPVVNPAMSQIRTIESLLGEFSELSNATHLKPYHDLRLLLPRLYDLPDTVNLLASGQNDFIAANIADAERVIASADLLLDRLEKAAVRSRYIIDNAPEERQRS